MNGTIQTTPHRDAHRVEGDELARHWGVAECGRCGRTMVLGEQARRRGRDLVCPECAAAPHDPAVGIAVPARSSSLEVPDVAEDESTKAA
ncbi:MAG TPA: hypothetical protein VMH50_08505 [Thermoleophilia bacterium]|nr:hypothetical protein [Thermoleophilia bacterium]